MPFRHHSFAISTNLNLFLKEVVRFYSSHEMLSDMYFLKSKMLAGPCMDSWETTLLHLNWSMFKIGFCIWHSNQSKNLILNQNASNLYFQCVIFLCLYYTCQQSRDKVSKFEFKFTLICPNFVGSLRFGKGMKKNSNFSCMFLNPNNFSSNCSNLLDLRNLQDTVVQPTNRVGTLGYDALPPLSGACQKTF